MRKNDEEEVEVGNMLLKRVERGSRPSSISSSTPSSSSDTSGTMWSISFSFRGFFLLFPFPIDLLRFLELGGSAVWVTGMDRSIA